MICMICSLWATANRWLQTNSHIQSHINYSIQIQRSKIEFQTPPKKLKIFVRVQTFRRGPPVLPCNFCHPDYRICWEDSTWSILALLFTWTLFLWTTFHLCNGFTLIITDCIFCPFSLPIAAQRPFSPSCDIAPWKCEQSIVWFSNFALILIYHCMEQQQRIGGHPPFPRSWPSQTWGTEPPLARRRLYCAEIPSYLTVCELALLPIPLPKDLLSSWIQTHGIFLLPSHCV